MQILTYHIHTTMGTVKSTGEQLDFLTNEQKAEFDTIGYRGIDSNGNKMGRTQYLNSLFPDKEQFSMRQLKFDNGNFNEEFLVIRVIIAQPKKEKKNYSINEMKKEAGEHLLDEEYWNDPY